MQHAEDYLKVMGTVPKTLLSITHRSWTDRLPNRETILSAKRIIDACIEGGTV